jgi:hypothetical protein
MKFSLVFLIVALLSVACFSQIKKDEDRQQITLCWYSDLDTNASYLIYYNLYRTADTTWRLLGTTKNKTFDVNKQAFKGDITFGVRSISYMDTSSIHTSLETTACTAGVCDTMCTSGAWYLSWHIKKPSRMKLK